MKQSEMKSIDFKGKPYIEVSERVKFFRSEYKGWSMETFIVKDEWEIVVMKAIIKDDKEVVKASWIAYEKSGSSFINNTSHYENCETSAWGRALANLWIWIDASIASSLEVWNAVKQQANWDNTKTNIETAGDIWVCGKCGAVNKMSQAGKPYCSAKCWL